MMIEGGTLGFLGVWGVIYTWGSVVTRWILSVHIGVALSWRHWTCAHCVDRVRVRVDRGAVVDTHGGTAGMLELDFDCHH